MVEADDGFEWFELLRPIEVTERYLAYTRWRSEQDFQRWQESQAFIQGHAHARADRSGESGRGPAATDSELWSFDVIESAGPSSS